MFLIRFYMHIKERFLSLKKVRIEQDHHSGFSIQLICLNIQTFFLLI